MVTFAWVRHTFNFYEQWRYFYNQILGLFLSSGGGGVRGVPSFASLWRKVLPVLKQYFIWLELIFRGQEIGCVLPGEGEEAIGQGKRGRHWREEGGVSVTLSARRRARQSPNGSQSTHWRSDPPRQKPSRFTLSLRPLLRTSSAVKPRSIRSVAGNVCAARRRAYFPSPLTARLERAPRPLSKLDRWELRRNKPRFGTRWVDPALMIRYFSLKLG